MRFFAFLVLLFIVSNTHCIAQGKINFLLANEFSDSKRSGSDDIGVLIKGEPNNIKELVLSVGGTFKYAAGNITAASLNIQQISTIVSNKDVQRLEAFPPKTHPLNDSMLVNNNVLPIHNGQTPLTQAYDGTDIVIGFIDTGIDITHPDFKDNLGFSRIKYLWDQTKPIAANTPMAPLNYGQEWSNTDIDSGQASAHNDSAFEGHGTHVAGIAAGNGLATGNYKGVAPNADIIMVAIDFSGTAPFSPSYPIADAVAYIYAKAKLMGKPCVINASIGASIGSHDGQDLEAQLISNLIDQEVGQSFVAAAGNSGNSEYHLGYTVTADTNFTMFSYNPGTGSIFMQMYADTNDLKNIDFAVGADQISPQYSFRGRTAFSDISVSLGTMTFDTLYNNGNRIGIIQKFGELNGGVYAMGLKVIPDSINYNWRLITTGTGAFDLWSFNLVGFPLPSADKMLDSIYYKLPDLNKTIETGFQCLDNVITVGNYTNRQNYKQYDGSNYFSTSPKSGKRVSSSGIGPTRDGRIKPDISAPGDVTIATAETALKTSIIGSGNTNDLAFGGFHVRKNGTSHSCPSVAGIVALYLQQNPTATAMQVKNSITGCATQDQHTGSSLPNNYWGYGKANAFGVLTNCITSVDENTTAQNIINIYPNPNSYGVHLHVLINQSNIENTTLNILNTLGELIKTIPVNSNNMEIKTSFSPGIYFYNLVQNGTIIATKKLVIL